METIKPCPFCGGEGKYKKNFPLLFVKCVKCGARGPTAFTPSISEIMNLLNTSFEEAAELRDEIGKYRAIKGWNKTFSKKEFD